MRRLKVYTNKSFQSLIDYWGKRAPEREAIFDGQQRISYGEFNLEIQQLASSFTLLDIHKGDKVILLLPNWYEFIAVLYGDCKNWSHRNSLQLCFKRERVGGAASYD